MRGGVYVGEEGLTHVREEWQRKGAGQESGTAAELVRSDEGADVDAGVVAVLVHHGAHGRRVLVVRVVEHVAEVGRVRGIQQLRCGVVEVVQGQEECPAHELALPVVLNARHEGQGEVEVLTGSRD